VGLTDGLDAVAKKKNRFSSPARNRTFCLPAPSLVTILTELPRFLMMYKIEPVIGMFCSMNEVFVLGLCFITFCMLCPL
jgi:hypothetical protein